MPAAIPHTIGNPADADASRSDDGTDMTSASAVERWSLVALDFSVAAAWGMTVARGRFDRAGGSYEVGPEGARLELTVDVTSIDTANRMWDSVLRSSAAYPQARFTSTRIRGFHDGTASIAGWLEAAGKTVPVDFGAAVERLDQRLRITARATVDQRQLGTSSGQLGLILPASVRINALFGPGGRAAPRVRRDEHGSRLTI